MQATMLAATCLRDRSRSGSWAFLITPQFQPFSVFQFKGLVLAAPVAGSCKPRVCVSPSKNVCINKVILESERSFTNPFVQSFATPLRALVPERASEQGVPRPR